MYMRVGNPGSPGSAGSPGIPGTAFAAEEANVCFEAFHPIGLQGFFCDLVMAFRRIHCLKQTTDD
jgi:hypothetical protein